MRIVIKRLAALMTGALLLAAPGHADVERCAMCHRAQAADPVPSHEDFCLVCHRQADAHMASPRREKPAEITSQTCKMCHRPTEAFTARPHHAQELECSSCHAAHKK
jgi:hypothetical protein